MEVVKGQCDSRGVWDKEKKKCNCDKGFIGSNCEVVENVNSVKGLNVPHYNKELELGGCSTLTVCPYGLDKLDPTKSGDYYKTGCLHGQTPTKMDIGDYKNCYVLTSSSTYGPDCQFRGYSKAGIEYDIRVQQNYCGYEAGDITTNASNYKSEVGSFYSAYGGGIVIGPKIKQYVILKI